MCHIGTCSTRYYMRTVGKVWWSKVKKMVYRVSKNDTRQITALPSARTYGTRQRIFLKNLKTPLCRAPVRGHSAKTFKTPLCQVLGQVALGKELKKLKKNFGEC